MVDNSRYLTKCFYDACDAIGLYGEHLAIKGGIPLNFTPNEYSHYDITAIISKEIYIVEHKYREDNRFNTYDKFIKQYPDGIMIERKKYDDNMNIIYFNKHIKGLIYVTSLPDGTHFIYDMNNVILPEQQQLWCNMTTHDDKGKVLKWVYMLPYSQAIILK